MAVVAGVVVGVAVGQASVASTCRQTRAARTGSNTDRSTPSHRHEGVVPLGTWRRHRSTRSCNTTNVRQEHSEHQKQVSSVRSMVRWIVQAGHRRSFDCSLSRRTCSATMDPGSWRMFRSVSASPLPTGPAASALMPRK